jgi:hypothetical protein
VNELPMADVDTERCCSPLVRKVTERDHVVWHGVEVSPGPIATRVHYECAGCGRRLSTTPPAPTAERGGET